MRYISLRDVRRPRRVMETGKDATIKLEMNWKTEKNRLKYGLRKGRLDVIEWDLKTLETQERKEII